MFNFFGGGGCGCESKTSSCDILVILIILAILKRVFKCFCESGKGFNIDICTIIILLLFFCGGFDFCGRKEHKCGC